MTSAAEPTRRRRLLRFALRAALVFVAALGVLGVVAYAQARVALGAAPADARLAAVVASPNFSDGKFQNGLPQTQSMALGAREWWGQSDFVVPVAPLPVVQVDPERFRRPSREGLRVTWLGHSTMVIEVDGAVILTDPVWGERTSPLSWVGPKRWYEPLIDLEDLPQVDAVVISHDHYDHLDLPTFEVIRDWPTTFVVPLGVGAHLERWGVPSARIVEVDWWESTSVAGVEITATPARHASGRHLFDRDRTLWAGFAFRGPENSVFFSGDTGMFPEIDDIGARLGPFDLTMIEVGTYSQAWPDWHMGPEQAIDAHVRLGGEVFLPVHWGLFNLSTHGWTEPVERVVVAAESRGVLAVTPRPGESYDHGAEVSRQRWWPSLPWRSAEEYPLVATQIPR